MPGKRRSDRFSLSKKHPDFEAARETGFKGFPAFRMEDDDVRQGVMESLLRRLPPRNREDFAQFLAQHRLPCPFNYSDMALLGYTGARLTSDGFALVPDFSQNSVPCDYLMEVTGLRHVFRDMQAIHEGDRVNFEIESGNSVDQDALQVICHGQKIGYVIVFKTTLHRWLQSNDVTPTIEKLNGKPERSLVDVLINAR